MSEPAGTHRVLFSVRNFWYLKYYDSVIRLLAQRGHRVHVVADGGNHERFSEWSRAMERLAAEQPGVTFAFAPKRLPHLWVDLSYLVNTALDHVRFFDTHFDDAPILRRRAATRGWKSLSRLMAWSGAARPRLGRRIEGALNVIDTAVSSSEHLQPLFAASQPDVVIVTPLVSLGAAQNDMVVAAKRQGIPVAVAVGSWDHLSSKSRIRAQPDRLFVWNETQRGEAVRYHGFPAERVVVTGAQCFDQWFGREPASSRTEFCQTLGLPEDRPLLLYVGSSLFWNSPNEAEFIVRWVAALRASPHSALRDASVLVRPHPKRGFEWDHVDVSGLRGVVVWPPRGQAPIDAESKATYFDSLYHSQAVIGLNTSALIEAGLIGRPVYTVLLPEFHDNQEGTLHFRYLLNLEGGLLHAARSLEEHFSQVAAGIASPEKAAERNRAFVQSFVRPHGIDTAATDIFVNAICEMAEGGRGAAQRPPWWSAPLRWGLLPATLAVRGRAPMKWVDRNRHPIPAWALKPAVERWARPAAPYIQRLVGSELMWREEGYRRKAAERAQQQEERLMARERLRDERRQRQAREQAEQRAAQRSAQLQEKQQLGDERERRRLSELAARAQALRDKEHARQQKQASVELRLRRQAEAKERAGGLRRRAARVVRVLFFRAAP